MNSLIMPCVQQMQAMLVYYNNIKAVCRVMCWAIHPEYWVLNSNLAIATCGEHCWILHSAIPESAMAEKLAADYIEEKVKMADFASAQPVLAYVSNADRAESCAIAQVRASLATLWFLLNIKMFGSRPIHSLSLVRGWGA